VKDLGLTFEDLTEAAKYLRAYAEAVEKRLYMDMKVEATHLAIEEANRLAEELDDAAAKLDTVSPVDLG